MNKWTIIWTILILLEQNGSILERLWFHLNKYEFHFMWIHRNGIENKMKSHVKVQNKKIGFLKYQNRLLENSNQKKGL